MLAFGEEKDRLCKDHYMSIEFAVDFQECYLEVDDIRSIKMVEVLRKHDRVVYRALHTGDSLGVPFLVTKEVTSLNFDLCLGERVSSPNSKVLLPNRKSIPFYAFLCDGSHSLVSEQYKQFLPQEGGVSELVAGSFGYRVDKAIIELQLYETHEQV